jgi:glutamine synthetase
MLTLEELTNSVGAGEVDTVMVAFTDMQGRLMGKRMEAHFFLEEMEHNNPIEGCNYLLALEMEMDPVPGYEIASWERGYGDFSTMRRIPWLDGTALVLCDVAWNDGTPVRPSPRQVLKAQVDKARALGYTAMFGSELEFFLIKETYAQAHEQHYRGLTRSSRPATTTASRVTRSSGRLRRSSRSATRPTRSGSPTTRRMDCRARSGRPTVPARCGSRGRSKRACFPSTAIPRCGCRRPSAGSSNPASGASWE